MSRFVSRADQAILSRRSLVLGAAIAGAGLALPRVNAALAQDGDLTGLGLPTIDVTVTPGAYEGVPETLEAGRYLVNVSVSDEIDGASGVSFMQPVGMPAGEFLSMLGMGAPADAPADASPEGVPEGEEGGPGGIPPFFYDFIFAGGAAAISGGTGSAVVDLTEGEWVAWGDNPEGTQQPVVVTVGGDFPADAPEPEAAVTFVMDDFSITPEGDFTAGEQVIKVVNAGAEPHFIDFSKVPDGTTNDEVGAAIEAFMTGTPVAGGLGEDDFESIAYTPTLSTDKQEWTTLTLEAGTYAATCWFPAMDGGMPHAMLGMHTVFEVAG